MEVNTDYGHYHHHHHHHHCGKQLLKYQQKNLISAQTQIKNKWHMQMYVTVKQCGSVLLLNRRSNGEHFGISGSGDFVVFE
jgi:hypothetical protein